MNILKIIEEEFNEVKINNVTYNEDRVTTLGKKYYPKLKVIDNRFYPNYPRNKGSYSLNGFVRTLLGNILENIFSKLKTKINNIKRSNTTNSLYFKINDIDFRISDHKRGGFNGQDIIFTLDTNIDELINNIYEYL